LKLEISLLHFKICKNTEKQSIAHRRSILPQFDESAYPIYILQSNLPIFGFAAQQSQT
jgi:hypothetical protein